MQWFDNPSALLVLGQCNGSAVEEGLGIVGGMSTIGHRNSSEVFTGRTEFVHISPGEHGDPRSRSEQPKRRTPAEIDFS